MSKDYREPSEWMKLPPPLQNDFFRDASNEVARTKHRMMKISENLKFLRKVIKTSTISKSDDWMKWRVAVVDGSNSDNTSERLGGRFGAVTAGYMIFEGLKPVEEDYSSDKFSGNQVGDPDSAEKLLSMLRVKLEREVALKALTKDVDILLLDGSFFGFRAEAARINGSFVDHEDYSVGIELTRDVREKTLEILRSEKAFGIIKRTRATALDGWLLRHHGKEFCIHANDKHILLSLLGTGSYFAYTSLFETGDSFNYYNRLGTAHRFLMRARPGENISMDEVFEFSKRRSRRNLKKSLDVGAWELIFQTDRYFVRCSDAPPFELESRVGADIGPLLSYFEGFHNSATGLPWPIDLVDENVSLPNGFTREFVDEIQAQLMLDPELREKEEIIRFFSYLNPQKPED